MVARRSRASGRGSLVVVDVGAAVVGAMVLGVMVVDEPPVGSAAVVGVSADEVGRVGAAVSDALVGVSVDATCVVGSTPRESPPHAAASDNPTTTPMCTHDEIARRDLAGVAIRVTRRP